MLTNFLIVDNQWPVLPSDNVASNILSDRLDLINDLLEIVFNDRLNFLDDLNELMTITAVNMNNNIKQMATICGLFRILSLKLGLMPVLFVLESIGYQSVITGFN